MADGGELDDAPEGHRAWDIVRWHTSKTYAYWADGDMRLQVTQGNAGTEEDAKRICRLCHVKYEDEGKVATKEELVEYRNGLCGKPTKAPGEPGAARKRDRKKKVKEEPDDAAEVARLKAELDELERLNMGGDEVGEEEKEEQGTTTVQNTAGCPCAISMLFLGILFGPFPEALFCD